VSEAWKRVAQFARFACPLCHDILCREQVCESLRPELVRLGLSEETIERAGGPLQCRELMVEAALAAAGAEDV